MLLAELGKLALETSRAIRRAEDPDALLNQVFLPAAVSKLFTVARKSKITGLMTTLRRLMASMSPAEMAVISPKVAFDQILGTEKQHD
jgi:hypothetical protein